MVHHRVPARLVVTRLVVTRPAVARHVPHCVARGARGGERRMGDGDEDEDRQHGEQGSTNGNERSVCAAAKLRTGLKRARNG
jgi:hypothetical protein